MSKKSDHRQWRDRELNAFPFLAIPLDERLRLSGNKPRTSKPVITHHPNGYWTIADEPTKNQWLY